MFFDGFGLGFVTAVVLVFVMVAWHSGARKEESVVIPVVEQNPGKWDIEL